jgi:hypothetical protein
MVLLHIIQYVAMFGVRQAHVSTAKQRHDGSIGVPTQRRFPASHKTKHQHNPIIYMAYIVCHNAAQ